MFNWTEQYATRASRMAASEIRELLKLLDQPDIISFAGGIPDPALFPHQAIADAFQRILANPETAKIALQYSVSEGYLPLRQWLVGYMKSLGVECSPENILITNGSQQALDFIGRLFISPGDTVLVARPTYLGALQAFNCYEPTYDVLPALNDHRTVESYFTDGARRRRSGPKFGYVMPEFENPTGLSLDLSARMALLDKAAALNLPLVEDTAYERLRYDGQPVPSLLALDAERAGGLDNGRVIYCGTFSKTIVPALRIGWVVAPRPVIQKLVLIKQASDLHTSPLNQMVMHDVAAKILNNQIGIIRDTYKRRRDAMLKALKTHMPAGVTWTRPEGGMFIWVTLPGHIDGVALLDRAVHEARVAFVPGNAFFADRTGNNMLRLSFSLGTEEKAEEGIRRLGGLVSRAMER